MAKARGLTVLLVLILAGSLVPVPGADACHRQRKVKGRPCPPPAEEFVVSLVKKEFLATVTVKGIAYAPGGTPRASASIFVTVKTAESSPTVLGGSETNPLTTGTNGSYSVTYDTSNLGQSGQINVI